MSQSRDPHTPRSLCRSRNSRDAFTRATPALWNRSCSSSRPSSAPRDSYTSSLHWRCRRSRARRTHTSVSGCSCGTDAVVTRGTPAYCERRPAPLASGPNSQLKSFAGMAINGDTPLAQTPAEVEREVLAKLAAPRCEECVRKYARADHGRRGNRQRRHAFCRLHPARPEK